MTPEMKNDVQASWSKVVPIADYAGQLFYQNLFSAAPELKPLFRGEMPAQARKLTGMITAAVARLDDLESLVPILQDLGRRHVAYGVQPAHYATVGEALLKTLEQGLGEAFTPATRAAWIGVYGLMTEVMTAAAAQITDN